MFIYLSFVFKFNIMETQDDKTKDTTQSYTADIMEDIYRSHRTGRFFGGLIIVAAGVALLLKQTGIMVFPGWLFTWPMFLIVLGLYIGARHSFRVGGWIIVMLVGGAFLAQNFFTHLDVEDYIWPIVIIGVGLMMLLPRRRWYKHGHWAEKQYWASHKEHWANQKGNWKSHKYSYKAGEGVPSSEDYIDSVSFFGGVHKVIMSKDFKGGDIVNVFGGTEINLTQADIKGKVVLEVVQIFGGTKIIIPSDWEVQSKMVAIFGGIEDKRNPALPKNPEKVLVIDGTSIFAGIDILSY